MLERAFAPPATLERAASVLAILAGLAAGCGSPGPGGPVSLVEGACQATAGADTEFLVRIGCRADFDVLASAPIDASLPGARSAKVVLDTADGNALYFQNCNQYAVHYQFAAAHLSGNGRPLVPSLSQFNTTEYYSPNRRFILGAVTYYEGPRQWALEVSPYDTASATMIETLFRAVTAAAYFGPALAVHPTSEAVKIEVAKLPADIPVVTTDDLYASTDYQPLNPGQAMGRLRFAKAEELDTVHLSFEDIVVLDLAPNDISVVQGLITEEFQTPLSHLNVLSRNRGTPNMGLRNAMNDPVLRSFEGRVVQLTVGALSWSIEEVAATEAQAFWDAHKPAPVTLPAMDLGRTDLVDIADVTPDPGEGETLREAIVKAVLAFGGKAAQYSVLAKTTGVPTLKAFAVPVFYYDQFMRENGFYARLDALLADPQFNADSAVRDARLADFRAAMLKAPVDEAFQAALKTKLAADYPGQTLRFRTSTNSEDLDGFPCAGCYESHTGDPARWDDVLDAIRKTFASAWLFRTFEERNYYGVDHHSVGMALLVHRNFPDEEANGVAITNNPFDPTGLDPAFYVNVQAGGDAEVVHPPAGVSSDQFLLFYGEPNQPVTYLAHSSLVPDGSTVLTAKQINTLGKALQAIHLRFLPAYGKGASWYGMDVEFKFDDDDAPDQPSALFIKQARPYPAPVSE